MLGEMWTASTGGGIGYEFLKKGRLGYKMIYA